MKYTTCYKAFNADVPLIRNARARFYEEVGDTGTNRLVISVSIESMWRTERNVYIGNLWSFNGTKIFSVDEKLTDSNITVEDKIGLFLDCVGNKKDKFTK